MSIYLVTWNLNNERTNYGAARTSFIEQINKLDNISDPGLESVRFISSTSTADQISAFLRQKMDDNDKLIVTKMSSGTHQGWLSQKVWNWINPKL